MTPSSPYFEYGPFAGDIVAQNGAMISMFNEVATYALGTLQNAASSLFLQVLSAEGMLVGEFQRHMTWLLTRTKSLSNPRGLQLQIFS